MAAPEQATSRKKPASGAAALSSSLSLADDSSTANSGAVLEKKQGQGGADQGASSGGAGGSLGGSGSGSGSSRNPFRHLADQPGSLLMIGVACCWAVTASLDKVIMDWIVGRI